MALFRQVGEQDELCVGPFKIQFLSLRHSRIRLRIEAPDEMPIDIVHNRAGDPNRRVPPRVERPPTTAPALRIPNRTFPNHRPERSDRE